MRETFVDQYIPILHQAVLEKSFPVIELYEKLSEHGFSKKNHFYKINILYMIAHSLYRNRKFKESNTYLEEMCKEMTAYNNSYFQQFYPKYIMLQAANFTYLNQNEKSITESIPKRCMLIEIR